MTQPGRAGKDAAKARRLGPVYGRSLNALCRQGDGGEVTKVERRDRSDVEAFGHGNDARIHEADISRSRRPMG